MMIRIRKHYTIREQELKNVLQQFIDDHKSMIKEIRASLLNTQINGVPDITAFQSRFESIKNEQADRERIIRSVLCSYEKEHNSFSTVMGELIKNNRQISFNEVKQAIDQILTQNSANA